MKAVNSGRYQKARPGVLVGTTLPVRDVSAFRTELQQAGRRRPKGYVSCIFRSESERATVPAIGSFDLEESILRFDRPIQIGSVASVVRRLETLTISR
jgi:hypothetical protein